MQGNLDVTIPLSSEAQIDLEWWMSNLSHVNGRKFSTRSPDIIIYSDVSRSGWGAFSDSVRTGGPWSSEDLKLHINALELSAASLAIRSFVRSSTAMHYLNKC